MTGRAKDKKPISVTIKKDAKSKVTHHVGGADEFDSLEHKMIGDSAIKSFFNEHKDIKEFLKQDLGTDPQYQLGKRGMSFKLSAIEVTAGDIIALAGDHYGIPSEPICDGIDVAQQKQRFIDAYTTLVQADLAEAEKILKIIDEQYDNVVAAVEQGKKPHVGMEEGGTSRNVRYTAATHGRYALLGLNNFDHFGEQAYLAYWVGHIIAMDTAVEAHQAKTQQLKQQLLANALTQELFACHFLTDLFAAGHIRVPRKELLQHVQNKFSIFNGKLFNEKIIAGKCAEAMHNEQNAEGLRVKDATSRVDDGWLAFGDGYYLNKENVPNKRKILTAVKAALSDIINSYERGQSCIFDSAVTALIPEVTNHNYSPMFKVLADGCVGLRQPLNELHSPNYDPNWTPFSFFKQYAKYPDIAANNNQEISAEQQAELQAELTLFAVQHEAEIGEEEVVEIVEQVGSFVFS